MRSRLAAAVLVAATALSFAPQASASHHVDCWGPIAPACGVINRYGFCHTPPRC